MRKCLLLFLAIVCSIGMSFAQETEVSGKVTDESSVGIPGVNVVLKGTTSGTVTDVDGNYKISVPSDGATLVFSFIGMQTREVEVGNQSVINITMSTDITALSEVIITAYGQSTKEAFTGSASVVDSEKLLSRNVTSPIQAIEGNATGVQFTSPAGPGDSPGIVIRGVGTLNGSAAPLYIVDGIQYNAPLNTLNQDDIESFTILKDAASTSLYGSRAANGVVIITTKKGKKGQIRVNASATTGSVSNGVPFYDQVTPGQYYEGMWEALRNTGAAGGDPQYATDNVYGVLGYNPFNVPNDQIVGTDGLINPNAQVIYNSLDWFEELQRTGIRQNYSFNVAGGGDDYSVFFSTSYLDDESFVIRSGFERLTSRLNAEFKINNYLTVGGSANVALTTTSGPTSGGSGSIVNPFGFSQRMGSVYPVYVNDLNGNIVNDADGNPIYDNGEGYPEYNIGSRPVNQGRHAIQELVLNNESSKDNNYGFRFFGDVKIIDGLNLRVTYGGDFIDYFDNEYENAIIGDAQPDGRLSQERRRVSTTTFNQVLTYNKTFGQHNIDLTAGHESYEVDDQELNGLATIQAANGIYQFANFSNIVRLNGASWDRALEGYFFRANYDFDNKYFISGSVRRDGTSSFEKENRWGTFYSVGASWRLDQEEFIRNIGWLNKLKLRASYGQVGNDNLGFRDWYLSQALFGITSNAASPAILIDAIGNSDLKWETSENYDVALEFALFDNLLDGSVEFYRRNSTDLLYNLPIAPSNGINEVPVNAATMYNQGIEMGLTGHILKGGDWTWDLTLLGTTFKNEITSIPSPFINGSKRWAEGRSRYDYFLYDASAGVDPATGDQLYYQYDFDADNNSIPVLDGGGNHATTNDWSDTQRGYSEKSSVPDFIGSVNNSLGWKGFDFNLLITYGVGGYILDNTYSRMMHSGSYGSSWHPDILNAWKAPGDETDVPRLQNNDVTLVQTQSTRFLISATYWAIRNASIGYSINPDVLNKAGINSLRIFVTGENLFLNSARKGLDPQYAISGVQGNPDFTPGRIFSIGLNLSL